MKNHTMPTATVSAPSESYQTLHACETLKEPTKNEDPSPCAVTACAIHMTDTSGD
jgi:hypothetical protein